MVKDLLTDLPLHAAHSRDELARTGVYEIRNLRTGLFYLGSTRFCFRVRFRSHLCALRCGKHYNARLQRSFTKYGENLFAFRILHCLRAGELKREQAYLDVYHGHRDCCNAVRDVNAPGKGRTMSAAGRARLAARMRGRTVTPGQRAAVSLANKSRIVTDETRAQRSETMKKVWATAPAETKAKMSAPCLASNYGRIWSAERRSKMAEANRRRIWKPESRSKLAASQRARNQYGNNSRT